MPTYEASCVDCDMTVDYVRPIAQCLDTPVCISCGVKMAKIISSPPLGFVKGKFEPFQSNVDGSVITCRRELDEHNKRNNVVNVADGWDEDTIKRGDYATQEKAAPDDLAKDIAEAVHAVQQGYKPTKDVFTDD